MPASIITNRSQLLENAKAYHRLITDDVYRLSGAIKKTALETITRTQAWIAVRDIDDDGSDSWFPVPQKWGGVERVGIQMYEQHRKSGIDMQKVAASLDRIGCDEVNQHHPAWIAVKQYAHDLGLETRHGAGIWIVRGEDLPFRERARIEMVFDLIDARPFSQEARRVIAARLGA